MTKNKIKVFVDGPEISEINEFLNLDGFTFNPSLFKKLGAKDYLGFTKEILAETKNKPVSIEVFADDEENCFNQAKKIASLNKNVYVKIPITYTNGNSTKNLIKKLSGEGILLNITAIFTLDQVKEISSSLEDKRHILSIFSGRLYDIGVDAFEVFKDITSFAHNNTKCETLWASCRMAYDLKSAEEAGGDIITMTPQFIRKLKLFGKNPSEYSLETVKGFFNDAKKAGYKI